MDTSTLRTAILPPAAARKLGELRDHADELNALVRGIQGTVDELRQDIRHRRQQVDNLTGVGAFERNGHKLGASDHEVQGHLAAIEAGQQQLARREARRTEKEAAWQAAGQLLVNVESWLSANRGSTIISCEAGATLRKHETPLGAVDRYRLRGRELRADLHRVRSAPIPSADAKATASRIIGQLADTAAPDCSGLIEGEETIRWPGLAMLVDRPVYSLEGNPLLPGGYVHDGLALAALLHPDALQKIVDREIDRVADDRAALSRSARAEKEAEILSDLLIVEREEEAAIVLALAEGREINRRADADPRAVLGVETRTTE